MNEFRVLKAYGAAFAFLEGMRENYKYHRCSNWGFNLLSSGHLITFLQNLKSLHGFPLTLGFAEV